MAPKHDSEIAADPAVAVYIRQVIERATQERLPGPFMAERAGIIYRTADRHGITTVILPTSALSEGELLTLLRFRLAHYLAIGFADHQIVYNSRMDHEPLANVSPDDLHILAGATETGEILCYATLKALKAPPPGATLRLRERPLFPVEQVHGWGIYNRLRVLPDLPLTKLRELGRFVKNQRFHTFDALGTRGPVEVGIALFRALAGPLRLEVDAIVGDFEEGVAKQNLEFFHIPMVVIHGTVPYEPEDSWFCPRYRYASVYPFAILSVDSSSMMLARLDAIDAALDLPGKEGLLALFTLKREASFARSSLAPDDGLAPLLDAVLPQIGVAMQTRRQQLDAADRLRAIDPFRGLSTAEAAVLGSLMTLHEAGRGEVIVRQGETTDDFYLIEAGQAEVRVGGRMGQPETVATLGPGDYFGEIALVTGAERMADVVAVTPMTLLRLTKETYMRYLAQVADVEQAVTRTALRRTRETARRVWSD